MTAQDEDPKYEHIEKTEKSRILDECDSIEKTVTDLFNKQEKLPKSQDPAFTVVDILKKKSDLERFANGILSKPKPAPPKEEKKAEAPKSEAPKSEAPKAEEPKTEQKKEDKPVEMDLD